MRSTLATVLLGTISLAGSMSAQPTVGGLLNNFSYIQPGLPNYGIAQGCIFDIFGTNLAASTASQGVPLQTTLAGTSISVTVNGVTTQPIPYFVSTGQIAAILPSATPVGTGTITVTSGGQTSATAPIVVVESAFGLLTAAATGTGAAAAYDYTNGNTLISQVNAANPGEYLVLWGSGLGPAPGDETQYQTPTNLSSIPIEVDIGGVSAAVAYHGRSAYPGLDQINVVVPAGVSGCSVSLVVTANGVPSNYSTIAVTASGRTCSDPGTSPITPTQYQTLLNQGTVNLGLLSLSKITTTTLPVSVDGVTIQAGGTTTSDFAAAFFERYTAAQFSSSGFSQSVSIGSCVVTTFSGIPTTTGILTTQGLNAGTQINLTGPDGALVLSPESITALSGFYTEAFSSTLPAIIPATGGTFTFNNGAGGPDVGAFTATIDQNLATPLTWTNMTSITSVTRANGLDVTWTGGIAGSYVEISGSSIALQVTATNELGASFACTAPVSAGSFTVPAAVLESLPASGNIAGVVISGSLDLANYSAGQFTAPGLDLGLAVFATDSSTQVPYI